MSNRLSFTLLVYGVTPTVLNNNITTNISDQNDCILYNASTPIHSTPLVQ